MDEDIYSTLILSFLYTLYIYLTHLIGNLVVILKFYLSLADKPQSVCIEYVCNKLAYGMHILYAFCKKNI